MGRYVPKTYNNWRLLRIIFRTIVSVVLAVLVLFIVLFFALQTYRVDNDDGTVSLVIPWLMDEPPSPAPSEAE